MQGKGHATITIWRSYSKKEIKVTWKFAFDADYFCAENCAAPGTLTLTSLSADHRWSRVSVAERIIFDTCVVRRVECGEGRHCKR